MTAAKSGWTASHGVPEVKPACGAALHCFPFERIEQYDDVEVKGLWRTLVEIGRVPAFELLAHLRKTSRDHARTPMLLDNGAGTTATAGAAA